MINVTVLKMPYEAYKKNTVVRLIICIAAVACIFAVNIVLYRLVSEATARLFTVINIVLDTACCWAVFYYTMNVLLVRNRLLKIYRLSAKNPAWVEGRIVSLSAPQKVYRFDCITAQLETDEGVRKVFIIIGSFEDLLAAGAKVRLKLCDNVAMCAEVENEE